MQSPHSFESSRVDSLKHVGQRSNPKRPQNEEKIYSHDSKILNGLVMKIFG